MNSLFELENGIDTEIYGNGDTIFKITPTPSWQDGPGIIGFHGEDAFVQIMRHRNQQITEHCYDFNKKFHSVDGFINGTPIQHKTQSPNYLLGRTEGKHCTLHHNRKDGSRDNKKHAVGIYEGQQINLYFTQYQIHYYTRRFNENGKMYYQDNKYAQDNWNHIQVFKANLDEKTQYRGSNKRGPFTAFETELIARVDSVSTCFSV